MSREARVEVAAWIIVAVWAVAYSRKIADPSFPVPAELTPPLLLAATYLFGQNVRAYLKRPKEDDDET